MSFSLKKSRALALAAPLAAALTFTSVAQAKENLSAAEIAFLRTIESVNTDDYVKHYQNPPAGSPQLKCPLVHVVVARGTSEPGGNQSPGLDGPKTWENGIPMQGADSKAGTFFRIANELFYPSDGTPAFTDKRMLTRADLQYPASNNLIESVPIGSSKIFHYLQTFNADCPGTKFVLQGYSQGALVIGNALARPSARINWSTPSSMYLTPQQHNAIVAVNWIGNPGFNRFYLRRAITDFNGPVIQSGFRIGTYNDSNKGTNDGNFIGDDPSTPTVLEGYSGITERDLHAFPVKTGDPSYEAVEPLLNGPVVAKIRDYCKSRDYICQWNNPNSTTAMHESYKDETTHMKNLYVFSVEKLKTQINSYGLLGTW